jgi:hypothetical protein
MFLASDVKQHREGWLAKSGLRALREALANGDEEGPIRSSPILGKTVHVSGTQSGYLCATGGVFAVL